MRWQNSDWENERRTLYEYDENKNRISYTDQVWHETWENNSRKLYAYDFQGRVIEERTYDWMYNTWIIKVDEMTKYEITTGVEHRANVTADMPIVKNCNSVAAWPPS